MGGILSRALFQHSEAELLDSRVRGFRSSASEIMESIDSIQPGHLDSPNRAR